MASESSSAPPAVNAPTTSSVDFKSTFTLLPHILKVAKAIHDQHNHDPQKQQAQIQAAVTEFQGQLQLCHQLLAAYPCLDGNPEQQKKELEAKKEQLRHKCDLLLKYKDLDLLSQQVVAASATKPSFV